MKKGRHESRLGQRSELGESIILKTMMVEHYLVAFAGIGEPAHWRDANKLMPSAIREVAHEYWPESFYGARSTELETIFIENTFMSFLPTLERTLDQDGAFVGLKLTDLGKQRAANLLTRFQDKPEAYPELEELLQNIIDEAGN
jgi:hypothetical protein